MKDFLEVMKFRHACKLFDEKRKILKEDILYILEAGRLSPSSFGMEQWRFLVIENEEIKKSLKPFCWNQPQITTCSHLIVIKAIKKFLKPDTEYVKNMFKRRGLSKEQTLAYIKKYADFMEDKLTDERLFCWSSKQCYIALANMMNAAAFKGIDSCAIEGFDKDKVEKFLKIDTNFEEVAVLVTFGYRVNEAPAKKRLPLDEIVEFMC